MDQCLVHVNPGDMKVVDVAGELTWNPIPGKLAFTGSTEVGKLLMA